MHHELYNMQQMKNSRHLKTESMCDLLMGGGKNQLVTDYSCMLFVSDV